MRHLQHVQNVISGGKGGKSPVQRTTSVKSDSSVSDVPPRGPRMQRNGSVIEDMELELMREDCVFRSQEAAKERKEDQEDLGDCITEATWFKAIVSSAVILNTLSMGFEADYPVWNGWKPLEYCFTGIFTVEMFIKIRAMRVRYFKNRWNLLDFFLVTISILDLFVLSNIETDAIDLQSLSIFRVLRLLRLVRVMRLVKSCQKFVLVCEGIVEAMQCTMWTATILCLAIYVGAVFCVEYIGRDKDRQRYPGHTLDPDAVANTDTMMEFNPELSFGSMPRAMLTLFNVAILAEWGEIVKPLMVYNPPMVLFFVAFVLFITFGVLNVIIGMICDSVMSNARQIEIEEMQEKVAKRVTLLHEIRVLVKDLDHDNVGVIDYEQLQDYLNMEGSIIKKMFSETDLRLPIAFTAKELMCMLDHDGDEILEIEEFVQSFYRLIESGPFQQICMLQTGINSLKRAVVIMHRDTMQRLDHLEASLTGRFDHCSQEVHEQMKATMVLSGRKMKRAETKEQLVPKLDVKLQKEKVSTISTNVPLDIVKMDTSFFKGWLSERGPTASIPSAGLPERSGGDGLVREHAGTNTFLHRSPSSVGWRSDTAQMITPNGAEHHTLTDEVVQLMHRIDSSLKQLLASNRQANQVAGSAAYAEEIKPSLPPPSPAITGKHFYDMSKEVTSNFSNWTEGDNMLDSLAPAPGSDLTSSAGPHVVLPTSPFPKDRFPPGHYSERLEL